MTHSDALVDEDSATPAQRCASAMHLQLKGFLDQAEQLYSSILRDQPRHAVANHCLGMLQLQRRRPAEGLPYLLAALEAEPRIPDYWLGTLEALLQTAQLETATHFLSEARRHGLAGVAVEAFALRLADTLREAGTQALLAKRYPEAEAQLRRSLAIAGSFAAHYDLGKTYGKQGRMREAEASIRSAIALSPDIAIGHDELGYLLWCKADNDLALSEVRRSIALNPDNPFAFSNLLGILSQNPSIDPEALFTEHRRFGEVFEDPLRASWPQHGNDPDPDRCLRVGIVSGDLYNHAVASFLEPLLSRWVHYPSLELRAYYTNTIVDVVTLRLRGFVRHWSDVPTLAPPELAQKIIDDGIDILIDLSGHSALNRLTTFARKPAPVQVTWIGYPGTTGLRAMDYCLADRDFLPPGRFDPYFTEKLVYMPAGAPFKPHPSAPPVNPLPALQTGALTFGSFNRINKLNTVTIGLWSELLRALPDTTLVIGGMNDHDSQERLIDQFAVQGVARERLALYLRCDMESYLALYHRVDICLDTNPYTGGTTSLHGLWMGVPTLTIAGPTPSARQGAALMANVGLEAFIATDAADFVAKGVHWAHHLAELADLRAGLRMRCERSPSRDPDFIAANVDYALRRMWQRWCAGEPPASFEVGANPEDDVLLGLLGQRRFAAALTLASSMTRRFPEHGVGWKVLGALQWAQGRPEAAVAAMQTAARLSPDDAEAFSNLGTSLAKLHRFDEAEGHLQQALRIDPGHTAAHYQLAMSYDLQGRTAEAEAGIRRGLATRSERLTADDEEAYSHLLFLMSHDPAVDANALFAEHRRVGDVFEAGLRQKWPRHTNRRAPERTLKVGWVSADLCFHAVASFIEPVLQRLGRCAGIELHVYYNNTVEDAVSRRLRDGVTSWRPVAGLSDEDLAQRIMDDGIDILIDLSGHTRLNRLRTFARKPAPIQISWCGYPGTTGLQAMDYTLADRRWLPPGFERQFTEKLLYLPATVPFQPQASAPPVNALPALTPRTKALAPADGEDVRSDEGRLTFGSFNRLGKINDSTIQLWSRLLTAVPSATLLIGATPADGPHLPALIDRFAAHGIARERLDFHPRCAMDDYLALHHRVDLCLDTHPYSGGTTTNHALWMGVPTLTLAGRTPAARQGAALMGHLGLDPFIAADADDFVAKGIYWAHHLAELAALRATLRDRCAQSPDQQPDVVAAALERTLRHVWRRWCAGLPPTSFDSTAEPTSTVDNDSRNATTGSPPASVEDDINTATPTASVEVHSSTPIPARPAASADDDSALLALVQQCRFAEALTAAKSMTERFPEHGLGWKILGVLRNRDGPSDEALTALQTAARLLPDDAEAHTNLGTTLTKMGRLDAAESSLSKALEIDPHVATTHYSLGANYELQGRFTEAEASIRRGMALSTDAGTANAEQSRSFLLFLMSHNPDVDADALFAEHRRVGALLETGLPASPPPHSNDRGKKRRLRVGVVSADLRNHAVASFIEPVLARLAGRKTLEVHAYYNYNHEDAVSRRLRGYVKSWQPVAGLSDADLARKIGDDRIDILIDLSGHTGLNRLRTFAYKPAPIQVSWCGYPGTTGLRAMDYTLADRHWLPPGRFDRHFTEKLVYLPATVPFQPCASAPAANGLPALAAGFMTFGSFNRLAKINAPTIRLWSAVLAAVPSAKLLIGGIAPESQRQRLIDRFAAHGVVRERLILHSRCGMREYVKRHHEVDLCLDTAPYSGGTTTNHALWMGVPTLTLAGTTPAGRQGAGLMGQLGLDAFIANDAAEFVDKGVYWAAHLAELAELRKGLRERCDRSPAQQPDVIVDGLERALRRMWTRWCDGLPAESFDAAASLPVAPPKAGNQRRPGAAKPRRPQRSDAARRKETALARERNNAVLAVLQKPRGMDEGLAMARSNTRRFPLHGPAWKTLGAVLWWQGSSNDAIAAMRTAARLSPDDAETHANLGMVLFKLERNDEAEPYLLRAIELDATFAAAHYHLGMTYLHQERYPQARISLRRGIQLNPDYFAKEEGSWVQTALQFLMSHDPAVDEDALFAEHCRAASATARQ